MHFAQHASVVLRGQGHRRARAGVCVHLVPDLPYDALATVLGGYLTGHLCKLIAKQAPPAAVHAVPGIARRFAVSLMREHEDRRADPR